MQKILLVMFSGIFILLGCSLDGGDSVNQEKFTQESGSEIQSGDERQIVSSASWVYQFVKWENETYVVTEVEVKEEKIGAEIGEVTFYSDLESSNTSGNFSNEYEEGTKYHEITNINKGKAIAIKVQKGKFIKAVISDIWKEENL